MRWIIVLVLAGTCWGQTTQPATQESTEARLHRIIDGLRQQIARLQTENAKLKEQLKEQVAQEAAAQEKMTAVVSSPMESIQVGQIGLLPAFTTIQVIDEHSMLVDTIGNKEHSVLIKGVSTKGMVDGEIYKISAPLRITGTTQYTTVMGANRTVFVAEPFKPD